MTDTEPSTADRVRAIVEAMAPGDAATPEPSDRLREDLGFESIRLIELTMVLEQAFALAPLPQAELAGVRRVGDVIELIHRHVPARSDGTAP